MSAASRRTVLRVVAVVAAVLSLGALALARPWSSRNSFRQMRIFAPAELEPIRAAVARLQETARPGDERSWWAKRADGRAVLCRLT